MNREEAYLRKHRVMGKPDFVDFACSCNCGICGAISLFISRGIPFMFSGVTYTIWFFESRELSFSLFIVPIFPTLYFWNSQLVDW